MPDPIPPRVPPYTPGGYWYRPPFTPRYTIPQSFGEALSYESQVHWIANLANDAAELLGNAWFFHFAYGDATVDTSAFERWHPFVYSPAVLQEGETLHPGDSLGLVVPDYDAAYKGAPMIVFAQVDAWAPACQRLALKWYATVHDPTRWLDDIEGDIDLLDNRATSLEQRMTSAEDLHTQLRADFDAYKTEVNKRLSNAFTQISDLQLDVQLLKNRMEEYEQTVQNLQQTVQNIQSGGAADTGALRASIRAIVAKVMGGGSVDDDTGAITWGDPSPIAVGTLNIYSGASDPATSGGYTAVKSHGGVADGDIWFDRR